MTAVVEVRVLILHYPRRCRHTLDTLCSLSSWPLSSLQVVKAFVVLAPQFLSHDKDQLTKELQQHVKSVTAPFKYPRKVRPLGSHAPRT